MAASGGGSGGCCWWWWRLQGDLAEKAELQEALIKSEELRLELAKTLINTQVRRRVRVLAGCGIHAPHLPGSQTMS